MAIKKVLVLTYYWPPAGGAGVQRWVKFVKYLPLYGFEPFVITVDPDLATYPQKDPTLEKDIPESIKVIRTHSFEPLNYVSLLFGKKNVPFGGFANVNKNSFTQRILRFIRGNFFLPDARKGWNKYALKAASQLILAEKISLVITTGPPHSTHLIGKKLKDKHNITWIADFRDPWTDIYYYDDLLHTWLASYLDLRLEKKVLCTADKLIMVSKSIATAMRLKIPEIVKVPITIITNGFDDEDFLEIKPETESLFTLTYTGTLTEQYNLTGLIRALSQLKKEGFDFKFRIVGSITRTLLGVFNDFNLQDNLELISYVEHKKSIEYLLKSTMLLLAIPCTNKNEGILTGKLFEYMASGKPILGIGPVKGDAAVIIEETATGMMFDYEDTNAMCDFIINLNQTPLQINNSVVQEYTRENLTKRLAEFISK